jgi:hypothetical protein
VPIDLKETLRAIEGDALVELGKVACFAIFMVGLFGENCRG